ncbi:hypothetical protein VST63_02825 [Mycolicibacterium sp. 050232]|nr:hypothetical protein [Mycolicibacterium sp. 050232]MED5811284.1 hypothetical protein [Mycolicibacterium sp. 050232]
MCGNHAAGEQPRELDGQKRRHRTVMVAELVADAADRQAVIEEF